MSLNLTAFSSAAVLPSSAPRALGEAAERVVVMHHGLAVGGELDVDLDREIACDGGLRPRAGMFSMMPRAAIVQAAMGDRPRRQPVRRAHRVSAQETSNTPSTSTAASAGSEATPTVVRAWRPLSPKAATIRSEAPFSTFGPSRKSGAELTKPPSRTTRTTLSRSPSAALICASRLIAQPRAAALPCSTVTPAPSLPLAISLPSGVDANLAGDEQQIAGADEADVVGDRARRLVQHDALRRQFLLDRTRHVSSPFELTSTRS